MSACQGCQDISEKEKYATLNANRLAGLAAEMSEPVDAGRVLEAGLADPFVFDEDELAEVSLDELIEATRSVITSGAFEQAKERVAALRGDIARQRRDMRGVT